MTLVVVSATAVIFGGFIFGALGASLPPTIANAPSSPIVSNGFSSTLCTSPPPINPATLGKAFTDSVGSRRAISVPITVAPNHSTAPAGNCAAPAANLIPPLVIGSLYSGISRIFSLYSSTFCLYLSPTLCVFSNKPDVIKSSLLLISPNDSDCNAVGMSPSRPALYHLPNPRLLCLSFPISIDACICFTRAAAAATCTLVPRWTACASPPRATSAAFFASATCIAFCACCNP